MAQRVIASQWQVLSPRRVVYPSPACGANDEPYTYRCEPHLELTDRVAERPVATNATTDAESTSPVVHPSLLKEYFDGLVFAIFGTSILWTGIILAIIALKGLLG